MTNEPGMSVTSGAGISRDGFIYEPYFRVVTRDDPDAWLTRPTGERVFVGRTLADLVAKYGWHVPVEHETDSGDIIPLVVLLEPLRNRDPETTYVTVGLRRT